MRPQIGKMTEHNYNLELTSLDYDNFDLQQVKKKKNVIVGNSVADPVHFFRIGIQISGSGFKNPDPDPGDPKKTGSDRIRILLRRVFYV